MFLKVWYLDYLCQNDLGYLFTLALHQAYKIRTSRNRAQGLHVTNATVDPQCRERAWLPAMTR